MKQYLLFTLTSFSVMTSAFAAKDIRYTCENRMYREAILNMDDYELTLQDSFVQGAHDLKEAVKNQLGIQGDFNIRRAGLILSKEEAGCRVVAGYMFACNKTPPRATISIEGAIYRPNDATVGIKLYVPVQVKELKIKSSLQSQGPHDLTDKTTTITMNQLNVEAEAKVQIDNQVIPMKWDTFFYTDSKPEYSFCKRK